MATVTPKTSQDKRSSERPAPRVKQDDLTRGGHRKKFKRRVLLAAGLFLLLVWLLPMIVAKTPLRNLAVGLLATDLAGDVRCESASLGWFSPVVLEGVSVDGVSVDGVPVDGVPVDGTDGQETTILNATRISSGKGLLGLILSGGQLGRFEIQRPKLLVTLRDGGSNLEDLLAPLLSAETTDSFSVGLTVVVSDGVITVDDTVSGERSVLSETNASLVMSSDAREPMRLVASAKAKEGKRSGHVSLDLTLGDSAKLAVTSQDLPVGPFGSLLRRFDRGFSASGRLTCQIDVGWDAAATKPQVSVRGNVSLQEAVVTASALGSDRLRLSRLAGLCDVSWAPGRLLVKQLDLRSDLGSISAHGEIDLGQLQWSAARDALSRPGAQVSVDVNLARAAAMLPETLRIKQSVQLDSGKIELTIVGGNGDNDKPAQIGQAQLRVTNLRGQSPDGRVLKWEEPLLARLVMRENAAGRPAGELICQSSFLTLKASGTFDQLTGTAQFNVGRLADQLGQFVDLGAVDLSGRGEGSFNWHSDVDGVFGAFASMNLYDFRLASTPERIWQEDLVRVKANATGMLRDTTLDSVYSANCDVESSGEEIRLQLTDPVFRLDELPNWPLRLRLVGNLANWADRLSMWARLDNMQIAGIGDLRAKLVVSGGDVELSNLQAKITDLQCRGSGWKVYEQDVQMDAIGKWTAADRRMVISRGAIRGKALAINTENLSVTLPVSGPIAARGAVSYRADLSRIDAYFADPQVRPAVTIEGALSGQIDAAWQQGQLTLRAQTDGENIRLVQWTDHRAARNRAAGPRAAGPRAAGPNAAGHSVAGRSGQVIWSEPKSRLVTQLSFDSQQDTLGVERFELVSPGTFELRAVGKMAELSGRRMIDLSGSIDYDLQRLSLAARPWLGSDTQFQGKGPRSFSIKGPLAQLASAEATKSSQERLTAQGAIAWSSGNVFGMAIGQGELQVGLDRGTVRIAPIDLTLSEGRLRLAPTLRIANGNTMLLLPKGPLLSKVRLTPQMCASAMKYIHPFLAGATQVDGRVSLELQSGQIPLEQPRQAKIAGLLRIHSVQISNGPLVQQLLPLLAIRPQRVPLTEKVEFWVDRGRVFHRGVGIVAGGTTITTRGSVGIADDTLDLVAEMRVPEKWLGNNALGTALRNQMIRIPIGGTLAEPKIDARQLERMRARFLGEAAGNLLRDELLDRVFGN